MLENSILTGFADEIDPMLEKQMEVLDRLGMKHIEMRGVDGKSLVEYPLKEVKRIKSRLDERGFCLSAVGSPIGKIGITEDFAPHMELFRHTVEIAHIMETPNIRMFSFYLPEECRRGQGRPEDYSAQVMDRLGQMADYAAANDAVLLHENEKEIYGDMADRCLEIMKNFYGDHFKAVFDFANFVQCRQDTRAAYRMLAPYIAYVHVKDAIWETGRVVPAGYGDGHVAEILKELSAGGYQGYLSLEPHLGGFTGFASLERGGAGKGQEKALEGPEAFCLAHESLLKILG